MSESCYFFAALECEAKPLIGHFKLKKETSVSAFSIYRGENITLTVTGLGKAAMAAGIGYSLALYPAEGLPVIFNIGIAGHKEHDLGALFAAEKIIDQDTGRNFYPQLVSSPPCITQVITTVSQPQLSYPEDTLYEMEASAFYETAVRFTSSELIQCFKVISDNQENSSTQIKPAQVSQWIKEHVITIGEYKHQLMSDTRLSVAADISEYSKLTEQWRFSSNEKIQRQSLLNKYALLTNHQALSISVLGATTGKEFLKLLRHEIDSYAFGGF